jgi:hypothetical protein
MAAHARMRARPAAGVSGSLQAVTTCGHERLLSDGKKEWSRNAINDL